MCSSIEKRRSGCLQNAPSERLPSTIGLADMAVVKHMAPNPL